MAQETNDNTLPSHLQSYLADRYGLIKAAGATGSPSETSSSMSSEDIATSYANQQQQLFIASDNLFGITSEYQYLSHTQQPCLVRIAPETVKTPSEIDVEKNNVLQRMLSTTRGIDHALTYQMENINEQEENNYENARTLLAQKYQELVNNINKATSPKELKNLEAEFSTTLSIFIYGYITGKKLSPQKSVQLLDFYRDLSATLEPAPAIMTIIDTKEEGQNKYYIETSFPITQKTEEQKKSLTSWIAEKQQNMAQDPFAQAIVMFSKQIQDDKTRLPCQTRKTIPYTVKNGYVSCSAMVAQDQNDQNPYKIIAENLSARGATIAFVGTDGKKKKELEKLREDAASGNSNQIKLAVSAIYEKLKYQIAADQDQPASSTSTEEEKVKEDTERDKDINKNEFKLHFTILNSWFLQKQDIICRVTKKAATQNNDLYSHVPTHLDGSISPSIYANKKEKSLRRFFSTFMKKNRLIATVENAVDFFPPITHETNEHNQSFTINVNLCASGHDRTSVAEFLRKMWFFASHTGSNIPKNADLKQAENKIRNGLHDVMLVSLSLPGARGMLKVAKTTLLSAETRKLFFLPSAGRKRNLPIDKKEIAFTYSHFTPKEAQIALHSPSVAEILRKIRLFIEEKNGQENFIRTGKQKALTTLANDLCKKVLSAETNPTIDIQAVITAWETANDTADSNKNETDNNKTNSTIIGQHRSRFFKPATTATQDFIAELKEMASMNPEEFEQQQFNMRIGLAN